MRCQHICSCILVYCWIVFYNCYVFTILIEHLLNQGILSVDINLFKFGYWFQISKCQIDITLVNIWIFFIYNIVCWNFSRFHFLHNESVYFSNSVKWTNLWQWKSFLIRLKIMNIVKLTIKYIFNSSKHCLIAGRNIPANEKETVSLYVKR